jgi:hypothetical protein
LCQDFGIRGFAISKYSTPLGVGVIIVKPTGTQVQVFFRKTKESKNVFFFNFENFTPKKLTHVGN